jgi:hypothetical protein
MICLQISGRNGTKLKALVRAAIENDQIKSFDVARVKGGLKIQHAKYPGSITLLQNAIILFAEVRCNNQDREWQLLESFVGRLAYHFKDEMAAINIQFAG